MTGIIFDLLAGSWQYVAGFLTVIVGVLMARQSGKNAVRLDVEREKAATSERMRDANADAPRDRRDVAGKLRDGEF